MTINQKMKFQQIHREGQSYLNITGKLYISFNTIKSYCGRNKIGVITNSDPTDERKG